MKNSFGDRMKGYENVNRYYLTKRMPLIIRLDGVHFHTFTKGLDEPYDNYFCQAMQYTMGSLVEQISGAKFAYTQSDEISILITDYDNLNTEPWFGKNLQKIVSVSSSLATYYFNKHLDSITRFLPPETPIVKAHQDKLAIFDARAFILPKDEVCNYFLWRERDCIRNSIQSAGHAHFSHSSLMNLNCDQIQEKLFSEKGINWAHYPSFFKNGCCARKVDGRWELDYNIPVFSQDRNYINQYVYLEEDKNEN